MEICRDVKSILLHGTIPRLRHFCSPHVPYRNERGENCLCLKTVRKTEDVFGRKRVEEHERDYDAIDVKRESKASLVELRSVVACSGE